MDLEDVHAPLAVRPINEDLPVELERVYISLSLTGKEPSQTKDVERMATRARPSLWPWRRPAPPPPVSDLAQALDAHPRLVILGDPGSGKSTLLRYLAITAVRARRGEKEDKQPIMLRRLGRADRPFPIFVYLNKHRDVTTWPKEQGLRQAIEKSLPQDLQNILPPDFFQRRMEQGNCWVLLDGFDEMATKDARRAMAQKVGELANLCQPADEQATRSKRCNRFVVTCRILGYDEQLKGYGFAERTLQELGPGQIAALVRKRYRILAEIGGSAGLDKRIADNAARAELLLRELKDHPGLKRLIPNPLLLSIIVLVHSVSELPEQREMLYRECVEIMVNRWRVTEDMDINLTDKQKVTLLAAIALEMHRQSHRETLPRPEVEKLVAAKLADIRGHDARGDYAKQASQLLEWTEEQHGLLTEKGTERGQRVVSFSHLTFQEYLAARAISEDSAQWPLLQQALFDDWWRETLLLYVGMSKDNADRVLGALLSPLSWPSLRLAGRCLAENPPEVKPELRRKTLDGLRTALAKADDPAVLTDAAEALALQGEGHVTFLVEQLQSGPPPQAQAVARALGRLDERLVSRYKVKETLVSATKSHAEFNVRRAAAESLGVLGDPRLGAWVKIPGGEFSMGTSDAEIADLIQRYPWAKEWQEKEYFNDEKPQHTVNVPMFHMATYPVTNAEYKTFVDDMGHAPPQHWPEGAPPTNKLNHPVVYVTWHDAMAYCAWLTERMQKSGEISAQTCARLPTEAEWEKAARRIKGYQWPWGNEWDEHKANTSEGGPNETTPVGIYPAGASLYGIMDMAGNVWEWCHSLYKSYPYQVSDGSDNCCRAMVTYLISRFGSIIHAFGIIYFFHVPYDGCCRTIQPTLSKLPDGREQKECVPHGSKSPP